MPSSATLLLAALEDEGATEAADELAGADEEPPPLLLPPQATRPIMQVLSKLVFRLINGMLRLVLLIADSLIVLVLIVWRLLWAPFGVVARILNHAAIACARLNLFEPVSLGICLNWEVG